MNISDEHKKRSPDCSFFTLSQSSLPTKGRKGRASKASRVSSQSTATINVDSALLPSHDVDQTHASIMTIDASIASTTAKGKKRAGSKKITTKIAQSQAPSILVGEEMENIEPVSAAPARVTRGRKRASDQMLEDSLQPEEPPKKRATRTRGSTAKSSSREHSQVLADITMEDAELSNIKSNKTVKGGKKRASSIVRKTSKRIALAQSAMSRATLRAAIPADDEIDAKLEADLNRYESNDDSDNWKVLGKDDSAVSQLSVSRNMRMSNVKTGIISSKRKLRGSVIEDPSQDIIMRDSFQVLVEPAIATTIVKKTRAKPGKNTKQIASSHVEIEDRHSNTMDIREFERSLEADDKEQSAAIAQVEIAASRDRANLSRTTTADDSGHETDGSVLAQNKADRDSKKVKRSVKPKQATRKASAKSKTAKQTTEQETAFRIPTEVHDDDVADELDALQAELEHRNIQAAQTNNLSAPTVDIALSLVDAPTPRGPVSIPRQTMSPEASPQPSDAENRPPSSRPSYTRPPLARYSPSGARTVRIALAPSTPTASSSKRNATLETTYPWAPADIDYILAGTPAVNKENLDSKNLVSVEEKKMSLEEWINWNAKKNEEKLKADCERMVGKFESEGVRALKTLEGLVCSD